jgi:hypothetical protein
MDSKFVNPFSKATIVILLRRNSIRFRRLSVVVILLKVYLLMHGWAGAPYANDYRYIGIINYEFD